MGACRRTTGISEASLRWHYPDQVQRVFLTHARLSAGPLAVLPCGSGRIIALWIGRWQRNIERAFRVGRLAFVALLRGAFVVG